MIEHVGIFSQQGEEELVPILCADCALVNMFAGPCSSNHLKSRKQNLLSIVRQVASGIYQRPLGNRVIARQADSNTLFYRIIG